MNKDDADYDKIASGYSLDAKLRDDRQFVLVPTAKSLMGNIQGKNVLDLACGSGYFSRLFAGWGANQVVAVDVSSEMITEAKNEERKNPSGVEFHVGDAANLGDLGKFDMVFAGFLLHYAATVSELTKMTSAISSHLLPGGRFVSFNENPELPIHKGMKYGVRTRAHGPIRDGVKVTRTHFDSNKSELFSFDHYHYEKTTYEKALVEAGLDDIEWRSFIVADTAPDPSYWQEYLSGFSIKALTAKKYREAI